MTAIPFSNQPQLGYGIYTTNDVVQILHLPKEKVRRWLKDYWDLRLAPTNGEKHSWGERRDKSINFYALVEFYVFFELRSHGVPMKRILETHTALRRRFRVDYPFASYRMMTDGKSILFSPDGGESIVDANHGMQFQLKAIIEDFVKKIDFDPKDQTALRLYPFGKTSSIVVDPDHQFGQPVVKGTNILAGTLHGLYLAGEKQKFIASLYDLKPSQVKDAIDFFQKAA